MKNTLTNLMMAAALLCTAGGALEAQSFGVYATVPFGWQANGHTQSAGEYKISRKGNEPVIVVMSTKDHTSSFLRVSGSSDASKGSNLVFHRYGSTYFLSEVNVPGAPAAKLIVSPAEKETIEADKARAATNVKIAVRAGL